MALQPGYDSRKVARIIFRDDDTLIVSCPYCMMSHKHGAQGGKFRSSHCFSGEYELGEQVSSYELACALRARERMVKGKQVYRAKKTAEKKAAEQKVHSIACGPDSMEGLALV